MWEVINRGKRGIALDLASSDGRTALAGLVGTADVFLTNFLPSSERSFESKSMTSAVIIPRSSTRAEAGTVRKVQSRPRRLRRRFLLGPKWCSPLATRPGSPLAVELPGAGFGDFSGGVALAGGIAAAVADRERTGRSRVVDVSLLAAGLWALSPHIAADTEQRARPDRSETPEPLVNPYRTADGRFLYLTMLGSDRYRAALCARIGRPELAEDPRFNDAGTRSANARVCIAELDKIFASRTYEEWSRILEDFDGPWHGVVTPLEARDDPQVMANDLVYEVRSPDHRPYRVAGSPVRFDLETPAPRRAPRPGEHTREVLVEAGLEESLVNSVMRRSQVDSAP